MKILITGAGGFIGSVLTAMLAANDVSGQRPEVFHLKRPNVGASSDEYAVPIELSGCTRKDFLAALDGYRFDYVVHLASYGVARGDRAVDDMIDGNVSFLTYLLLALAEAPRLIVNIGSSSEYGYIADGVRVSEDAPLRPLSMYGGAKAAAEAMATALAQEQGLRLTTLRLFGVYGEGEGPQRLLPFLVGRLLRKEPVELTSGTQVRDWLHVRDVVSGLFALLAAEAAGSDIEPAYNLCSGQGVSVRSFVEEILLVMGGGADLLRWGAITRTDEPTWLVGDPARFQCTTSWTPHITLHSGVAGAVAHYIASAR